MRAAEIEKKHLVHSSHALDYIFAWEIADDLKRLKDASEKKSEERNVRVVADSKLIINHCRGSGDIEGEENEREELHEIGKWLEAP